MALGAFFSAAEVIPLTFLTVEAWSFLQLGHSQQAGPAPPFPHRWAVMFLASVGSGTSSAPGCFGFLINLPVVSYYEIGTLSPSNHGSRGLHGRVRHAGGRPRALLPALHDSGKALVRPGGARSASGHSIWAWRGWSSQRCFRWESCSSIIRSA